MPQMFPSAWSLIFIFFILLTLMLSSKFYFFAPMPTTMSTSNSMKPSTQKNWKW